VSIPAHLATAVPYPGRVLLLALTLALAPAAPCAGDDEEAADVLLAAAEELARRGKYDKAVAAYRELAELFPLTESGGVAQRRSQPSAFVGWDELVRSGRSGNRVDFVLMGDGYELKKQKEFDKLAARIPEYFERQGTFGEYYAYLNFLRANLVSADSGMDGFGKEYDTALDASLMMTHAGNVVVDHALVQRMLDELPGHDLRSSRDWSCAASPR
jgi:tetratricopeptide (TPR) repeat protein